jgi:ABC-type branched-subunit amino acid transport system ATPase component
MLEICNLEAGYGRLAVVKEINLVVQEGEIVSILGRNGTGKSTLLRAIIGLVRARRGSIRFNETDVSHLPAHARSRLGIGYVPQGKMVFPRLSVRENLQVPAFAAGQCDSRVEGLLQTFPFLYDKRNEIASRLSGGQQQLLAIARALASDPRLLLLDEPSEGLQPRLVEEVLDRMRAVNRDLRVSVLLVEQNLEFALEAATRVYIIDRGQIAAEMPSNALRGDERLQHELLGI